MGLPLREETLEAAKNGSSPGVQCGSCGAQACQQQGNGPQSVFEYGNLRPDVPDSIPLSTGVATRGWLLRSRLYSFNQRDGVEHAAVRLEESGYAVLGYVMMAPHGTGIAGLLEESERRQYSPQLYERDVVEVITEMGEQVRCFVYHRPDVDRSTPILTGDWCSRRN